jgi:NTP pyrophosphatase (non-canonical NTP hydrolase)
MNEHVWDTVDRLVEWLDGNSALAPETVRLLRVMKLSEEVGETTQAIIGVLGQNPRKGVTHSWQDVEAELCDVILTAMVALATLNPEARKVFAERLEFVAARSLS